MRNFTIGWSPVSKGAVAIAAVLAGSLLASEVERAGGEGVEADEMAIPAPPAPIMGVEAPQIEQLDLGEADFVVPVLRRMDLRLPEPPAIDMAAWREKARPWLGDGVMPAPTTEIQVDPPTISAEAATFDAPSIETPVLERPELPAPPAVR
ncbi:MAG: hypothetical protein ACODAB_00810 [Gemmatimonadota bacterium]